MPGSEPMSAPARSATLAAQQESLRRVAALVAGGAASADVFAAIAREVGEMLQPRLVQIFRWEPDMSGTVVGTWGEAPNPFPVGSNWPWDDPSLVALIEELRAGRPVRFDDVAESLAGTPVDAGLGVGVSSAAGAPILVEGEPWGHMSVVMARGTPLPDRVEERIAEITDLVATAISSSASREHVSRLAEEQAALRRVATLVARAAPPSDVFDAVAEELGRLLGVGSTGVVRFETDGETGTVVAGWGRLGEELPVGSRLPLGGHNVVSVIARTGAPVRLDDVARTGSGPIADAARRLRTRSAVGSPVFVAGRLWGAMIAAALEGEPLPADAELRLDQFTELVGTAIANAEARVELSRLAEEQAALRRVATLVAQEAPAEELFAKVAEEVACTLGTTLDAAIFRFEPDETGTVVAVWGDQPVGGIRVNARLPLEGTGATARVYRERRAVRVDDYAAAEGPIVERSAQHGTKAAVGCPIVVQGRLWGAMIVATYDEQEPFPPETERRISQFTELVATAIANAEARAELQRLADEQAALRRVATLVAEAAAPIAVFDAVIVEVGGLLGAAQVGMMRAEGDDEVTVVAHRGQDPALVRAGMRLSLAGDSVTARVLRTGRSARINFYDEDDGPIAQIAHRSQINATVGAPITVEGRLWGVITASWDHEDLPPADAEERLATFAELLDTAIANADSRDQLTASRARVLTAGDDARRQVVRDLHDGAQQRLVHAIVSLKLAQRALGDDDERAAELVAEALGHAEQGNDSLRELAHGILPATLTHGGLRAGVDAVVSRIDLPVYVNVTTTRLPPEIEASAYFIVAEALTNVVKHARATRAEVAVGVEGGALRVEVRDDGIGDADPSGQGLLGLGDRAAALGGRLRIDSPHGGGTVLAAELPLP